MNPREGEFVHPNRIIYSIPEKIEEILDKLKLTGLMPISAVFESSRSRPELVATLIAVLELCKVGSLIMSGDPDALMISYTGVGRREVLDETSEE